MYTAVVKLKIAPKLILLFQGNESQKVSPKIQDALVQLETNLKGEIQGIKSVASN